MRNGKSIMIGAFAATGMLLLILDSSTALISAAEGAELCLRTIIPSLFPFFVLSGMLTATLSGHAFPLIRPLCRALGIPAGCESTLLVGLLGGYPVGAQSVVQAYQDGVLEVSDARRLLGFCSNAGPSFLFGIVGQQFDQGWMIWTLWGIHILSALMTGMILSARSPRPAAPVQTRRITLPQALDQALKTTARVCGWVILFRIVIGFLNRWVLWILPSEFQVILSGVLELSNGCCALNTIGSTGLRFVAASVILAFGGICVLMQTMSITGSLGLGLYIPGKLIQTILSFQMSYVFQRITFGAGLRLDLPLILTLSTWIIVLFMKISVAIPRRMMYNPVNTNP